MPFLRVLGPRVVIGGDLVEELPDVLEGLETLNLGGLGERSQASKKEEQEGEYRIIIIQGSSSVPEGGVARNLARGAPHYVDTALNRRRIQQGKIKVIEYVQRRQRRTRSRSRTWPGPPSGNQPRGVWQNHHSER